MSIAFVSLSLVFYIHKIYLSTFYLYAFELIYSYVYIYRQFFLNIELGAILKYLPTQFRDNEIKRCPNFLEGSAVRLLESKLLSIVDPEQRSDLIPSSDQAHIWPGSYFDT